MGITRCRRQGKKDNHMSLGHPEDHDLRKDMEAAELYLMMMRMGRIFSYAEESPKDLLGSQT